MPHPLHFFLHQIAQGYRIKAWHGPNLRGALRGVTAAQAAWKPATDRHSIWEIAIHCAYWKHVVRTRLTPGIKDPFPKTGSNWFVPFDFSDRAWKKDLQLLEETHVKMRESMERLKDSDLEKKAANSSQKNAELIWGIAAHDVYHAGQIQLLKKLKREIIRTNHRRGTGRSRN